MSVSVIHLSTGEDIIGTAKFDEGTHNWVIGNPVSPQFGYDPGSGRMRMALTPLRAFNEDNPTEITVSTLHVIYVVPASDQLAEAYRQYNSPISLPTQSELSTLLQG